MKYKSCEFLRHAIMFWTNQIDYCCHSGIRFLEFYKIKEPYNGEALDWDLLMRERKTQLQNMKEGNPSIFCKTCQYYQEKDWDDWEPYINFIIISHWTHCNSNCIYCDLDKKPKIKPYNFMPILKDMKEKNILRFDGRLSFGGGEPTLLKEFDKIMDFFYKNNIASVQINSSGIKFSKSIEKYISQENTRLTISPDSSNTNTYRIIKRVDKFNEVWKNIKKYAKAQKNNKYGVATKYILLPYEFGVYTNAFKEQIKNWLILSKESNVNSVIMDIESHWYTYNKNKIDKNHPIIEFYQYFEQEAKKLDLHIEYYAVGELIKPLLNQ